MSNEQIYEAYEEIIGEAIAEYGVDLTLLPIDEIEDFMTIGEFEEIVYEYCESVQSGLSISTVAINYPVAASGVGVVTVPNVVTIEYPAGTVTVSYYGTFEIQQRLSGQYYIADESYRVFSSSDGNVSYVLDGEPVPRSADGGRTRYVQQNFKVYLYGTFSTDTSVTVSYCCSPATGTVSISSS